MFIKKINTHITGSQDINKDDLKLKTLDKITSKIRTAEIKKAKAVYMKSMKQITECK